jgi:hypothetical protein
MVNERKNLRIKTKQNETKTNTRENQTLKMPTSKITVTH